MEQPKETIDMELLADLMMRTVHIAALKCSPQAWINGEPTLVSVRIPKEFKELLNLLSPTEGPTELESTAIQDLIFNGLLFIAKENENGQHGETLYLGYS